MADVVDLLEPEPDCVTCMKYSPLGTFLIVATLEGKMHLYDALEGYLKLRSMTGINNPKPSTA